MAINVGDAEIKVSADGKPFLAQIQALGKMAEAAFAKQGAGFGQQLGQALGQGLGGVGQSLSMLGTFAGAAGPAVVALGSALNAAAAGAVQLLGSMGPALTGSAFAGLGSMMALEQGLIFTKFAFSGLSSAVNGNKKAMAALSPEARGLATQLKAIKPQLDSVKEAIQKSLFPALEQSLSRLGKTYFPLLRTAASQTGTALAGIAKQATGLLNSGPFRADFATITKANASNLSNLGTAFLHLLDALRSLLVASAPVTAMFTRWFAGFTGHIDTLVQAGRATGQLGEWFRKAGAQAAEWGKIIGNLMTALFNVFKIGNLSGPGGGMLQVLVRITDKFKEWSNSAGGIISIANWFARGRDNLAALGRFLSAAIQGLSKLGGGQQLGPLIDQITNKVLPPLMQFLGAANSGGALSSLVDAVASVLKVFANVSSVDGSLRALSQTIKVIADSINFLMQHIPGFQTAMGAVFVALGVFGGLSALGLGPAIGVLASGLGTLTVNMLGSAAVIDENTAAVDVNSAAYRLSHGTLGTWLGVKGLELAAWARGIATKVASTAATVANTVATQASAAASKAWAAAQWLLNAALDANPITLIVIGIAALIGGLILAYQHSAAFRAIVQQVWAAIKVAISVTINWITGTAWPAIQRAWNSIVSGTTTAWHAVTGFFTSIGAALVSFAKTLWNWALDLLNIYTYPWRIGIALVLALVFALWKVIGPTIMAGVQDVVNWFKWLWAQSVSIFTTVKNFVVNVWNDLLAIVAAVVAAIVSFIRDRWAAVVANTTASFNMLRAVLTAVWDAISSVVRTVSSAIWGFIVSVWNSIAGFVSGVAHSVYNTVSSAFNSMRSAVSSAVSSLWGIVSTAFNNVVNAISGAATRAWNAAKSVGGQILNGIRSIIGDIVSAGGDIVSGLIRGITGAGSRLAGAVMGFIKSNVPGPVLKVLGIASPSKLMASIARWIPEGLAVGITANADSANRAMTAMTGNLAKVGAAGAGNVVAGMSDQLSAAIAAQGSVALTTTSSNTLTGHSINAAQAYVSTLERNRDRLAGVMSSAGSGLVDALSAAAPTPPSAGAVRSGLTPPARATSSAPGKPAAGGGGDTNHFDVTISVDDLEKMSTVADFVDMLKSGRVTARKTLRSGTVKA